VKKNTDPRSTMHIPAGDPKKGCQVPGCEMDWSAPNFHTETYGFPKAALDFVAAVSDLGPVRYDHDDDLGFMLVVDVDGVDYRVLYERDDWAVERLQVAVDAPDTGDDDEVPITDEVSVQGWVESGVLGVEVSRWEAAAHQVRFLSRNLRAAA
jgi:hypothetical protein